MQGQGRPVGDRIRLFVAVVPPLHVREEIAAGLGEPPDLPTGRWIEPEAWHLTLQFLGHVDAGLVDRIRLACAFAAGRIRPFRITFGGSGAFPSPRRARVVWVGVDDPESRLAALSTSVSDQTAKLGFEPEAREFRPHLTIGRLRDAGDVSAVVAAIDPPDVSCVVEEVTLMESRLESSGARYVSIDTFPLQT